MSKPPKYPTIWPSTIVIPMLAFLASRLAVFLIAYWALLTVFVPDVPGQWRIFEGNLLLDGLVRWDSAWHHGPANEGYAFDPDSASNVAFFPAYSWISRMVGSLTGSWWVGGIVVSNLAFLGALILVYRWVRLTFEDDDVAERTVWLLAFAPAGIFFSAVYSESLFLFFAVLTFWATEKRYWLLASFAASLAAATRVVGIGLSVVLVLAWLPTLDWPGISGAPRRATEFCRQVLTRWREWLCFAIAPLGLFGFMLFQQIKFGDPLAFVHTQVHWDRDLTGYFARVYFHAKSLLFSDFPAGTDPSGHPLNMITLLDLGTFIIGSAGGFYLAWKRKFAAAFFVLWCLWLPAWTNLYSLSRFVLAAFPVFAVVAHLAHRPRVFNFVFGLNAALMAMITMLFATWHFVG